MSHEPVCRACDDTHQVWRSDIERYTMCTACPVPCQKCRKDGIGPYCAETPCSCECHKPVISEADKLRSDLDEAERLIIALNEHEGTEGWSASLRADLNAFLAKRKKRPNTTTQGNPNNSASPTR